MDKLGINKLFDMSEKIWPGIVIKCIISGVLFYFIMLFLLKRKLRKDSE